MKFKFFYMLILWIVLLGIFIPSCGKKIDRLCIKGKVKGEHIVWIKGINPPYVFVNDGDRILRKECAELMRTITFRDQYDALVDALPFLDSRL